MECKEKLDTLMKGVDEKNKKDDNWDYEMQRRYGYTFKWWEEYKPWK